MDYSMGPTRNSLPKMRNEHAKEIFQKYNVTMEELRQELMSTTQFNLSSDIDPTSLVLHDFLSTLSDYDVSDPDGMYATVNGNITTTTNPDSEEMCQFLNNLNQSYEPVHGYLSLVVCIFGTIANILNIAVLTRKEMNGSPINRILTGIAVADMLVMVDYIPVAIHLYLWKDRSTEEIYSKGWTHFVWFHLQFSTIIHNVSVWLTLSLAVWRFIMIRFHTLAPVYCTMTRCKLLLFCSYVIPFFITLPYCFAFTISEKELSNGATIYTVDWSSLAMEGSKPKALYYISIWVYSFILKLIPSLALTVITGFLIKALYKAEERSARLKNGNAYRRASAAPNGVETQGSIRRPLANGSQQHQAHQPASSSVKIQQQQAQMSKRKRNTDRTTRLLIAILTLFLLTEFPQGIIGLISAIKGSEFFRQCYQPLGELMDAMALINSSINFILYCFMSKQFRKTFAETFHLKSCTVSCRLCNACWRHVRSALAAVLCFCCRRASANNNHQSRSSMATVVLESSKKAEVTAMLPKKKRDHSPSIEVVDRQEEAEV